MNAPPPAAATGSGTRFISWIASLGPLGFFPIAPATFASFVLAALFLLAPSTPRPLALDLGVLIVVTAIGIWSAGVAERRWGHDARHIVIDEAAGMVVTLFLMPADLRTAGLGFLFFRIFDILKPFPGRRAESLPGGWGVVTDDLIAGLYAHLALRITLHFLGTG